MDTISDANWDVQGMIEAARNEYEECKFDAQDIDDCMEDDCPLYHTCHRR